MNTTIGLPFLVEGSSYEEIIKLIRWLVKEDNFVCNLPLNDNQRYGTHGDFGSNYAYINIVNKSYWYGFPGIKCSDYLFDVWFTIQEFKVCYKIIKSKQEV